MAYVHMPIFAHVLWELPYTLYKQTDRVSLEATKYRGTIMGQKNLQIIVINRLLNQNDVKLFVLSWPHACTAYSCWLVCVMFVCIPPVAMHPATREGWSTSYYILD